MSILAVFRRLGFQAIDAISGGLIQKAYTQIKRFDELNCDVPEINEYHVSEWTKLKNHAVSTTDFYKGYADKDFLQFPIITKNDIRSHQDEFMSSSFKKENLYTMSTSGSTGTPFVCYQNKEKKKRVNAEIIYYSEKVGYKLGNNLSYIRTVVKQVKKSSFKQFIQNQTLINCSILDDSGIKKMIEEIQKYSKDGGITLLGYASTYTAIVNYLKKEGIAEITNCKVTGIISGSEILYDYTRTSISNALGNVPVVSRYSNEENGVIGQDEGINNVFTINEADYIIEVVDNEGNVLPDNTIGRIVVTDLYNYAMPMIRYDTGDVGAIGVFDIKGKKKRCICNFSGRKVDVIFDTEGKAISPHLITNHMWSFPDILQYQVIQREEKTYVLRLNLPRGENSHKNDVIALMKKILGEDADIIIELVDEIPVLASGKRRYIVNEWKK